MRLWWLYTSSRENRGLVCREPCSTHVKHEISRNARTAPTPLEDSLRWVSPCPPQNFRAEPSGFSLLEIMLALSIFTIVLGVTAQSLLFSYAAIALQHQRTSALSDCRAVLSAMRHVAYNPTPGAECPADRPLFPCALLAWVAAFPESIEDAMAKDDLFDTYAQFFSLPHQNFEITCRDAAGNAAVIHTSLELNTNPVYVTVTTTWIGVRGHTYTVAIDTVLTDR